MKIKIKRYKIENNVNKIQEFEIKENQSILQALFQIKKQQDSSLSFRCSCKSGVCGSCAIRVNGIEKLACKTSINENDILEPLNNSLLIKDLIIDLSHEEKFLKKSKSYLSKLSLEKITKEDEKNIDVQSNCILCQSCFSSCPIYEVNEDFLGPYTLTRAFRYVNDKKELDINKTLSSIQDNGIWDCTLCGNCTLVCPQYIDPKNDILQLRMKSVKKGYEDKSLNTFDNFDMGFNPQGGFDPNSF